MNRFILLASVSGILLSQTIRSCFGLQDGTSTNAECAHVVGATATSSQSDGSWTFSATVASTETGEDKYANDWKIFTEDEDGVETVFGTRVLGHPHVNEQPFTRSLSGVVIPETVTTVKLAANDSVLGYCGDIFTLMIREPDQTTSETTGPPTLAPASSAGLSTESPQQADPATDAPTTPSSSGFYIQQLRQCPILVAILLLGFYAGT